MPANPATTAVQDTVFDILSKFLRKHERHDGSFTKLEGQVYARYKPSPVEVHGFKGMLRADSDLELRDQRQFLFLEPIVDKKILPLLTLKTSNRWDSFRAYVLLTMLDRHEALQSLAIRFETDEGMPESNGVTGSHDFCHVQLCRRINDTTRATTPSWLPESQPSLPLDAEDQISLVLCMLISLYGGRYVAERLYKSGDRDLLPHLKKVRALSRMSR